MSMLPPCGCRWNHRPGPCDERAWRATFSSSPERTAEISVGPSLWASGDQLCGGTRPTSAPYSTVGKQKPDEGRTFRLAATWLRFSREVRRRRLRAPSLRQNQAVRYRTGLGNADATQDEISRRPRWRSVSGNRKPAGPLTPSQVHGDPEDPEVVGQQGQRHGEDEELVHGVVKAICQAPSHPSDLSTRITSG